jgi:RimJ/RimL family protein N-acetyltransferase
MRRAVLTLAFGELGAEWAVSSAWADNAASLGVSRALGYELNGLSRHAGEGREGVLQHVLLTRERWDAGDGSAGITIRGFDACRPMFGLDPA